MEAIADAGGASCGNRPGEGRALDLHRRRRPAETVLHQLVQEHLETFLALVDDPTGPGLPGYVERDFRKYLDCGIPARGFARARCKDCGHDYPIAFSCKARGACPSCNTRRMVEIAAHLVDHVIPPVPVRMVGFRLPTMCASRQVALDNLESSEPIGRAMSARRQCRCCGHTDFQGGDAATLYRSIHDKLFSPPGETLVYPAHDYEGRQVSSIAREKQRRPGPAWSNVRHRTDRARSCN